MSAEGDVPVPPAPFARPREPGEAGEAGRMLDRLFSLAIVVCVAATLLVLVPDVHGHAILPTLDLVIDTVALVVCLTLTGLAWARFRERLVTIAGYHAAAFLALATAYLIAVTVTLQRSTSVGDIARPEATQALVFAVAQMIAAILFVIAGTRIARQRTVEYPAVLLLLPAAIVLAAQVVSSVLGPPPGSFSLIADTDGSGLPTTTPFGAVVHAVTAGLFFVGAYDCRRIWHQDRTLIDGWIAMGLVFAGFAELNRILFPSAHPGQVAIADVLVLASSLALLLGLESAVRSGLRELRAMNSELAELRDVEVERAALEERARLARELHDGLAQDLWLAKLRTGELVGMEGLPLEAKRAADDAAAAIDIGLGGAREAVAALRSPMHADSGFCNLLRRTVEDYGDRFGLRVEFTFDGVHTTHIAPRTQAEILRIAQEAMTNVARHANATVVGVRLTIRDDRITLRVADNGSGFDVALTGSNSYGLMSMRERASLIGGRLRVASHAGAGTRVVLTAPFAPRPVLVEAESG